MKRRIILYVSLVLMGLTILPTPVAIASTFGRGINQAYYDGYTIANRSFVMPPIGVTQWEGITRNWATVDITLESFIAAMRQRLYDNTSVVNRARVAAMTNMMMGINGNSPLYNGPFGQRHLNGIKVAQDNFATWEAVVRQYHAKGWVEWNTYITSCQGEINGFGVDAGTGGSSPLPDVTFSSIWAEGCFVEKAIVFHVNGSATRVFTIKDKCGNMTGEESPFSDFNIQSSLQNGINTPDNPPGNSVHVGNSPPYQVKAAAWNAGPGPAIPQTYKVTVPAGVTVSNTHGGVQSGSTVTWTGVTIPSIGIGGGQDRLLDWTVNAGTPGGTSLTFTFTTSPVNNTGGSSPPASITYIVKSPRYPSVQAENSDVHAGGGLCTVVNSGTGAVKGFPGAGSFGQYVVSASGDISTFGSNNSANSTALNLGVSGAYTNVCRPDLYAAAVEYRDKATEPLQVVTATNFDVTNKSGVYYLDSATGSTTIFGTVSQKITLVARGSIIINGRIVLDTVSRVLQDLPSLGVIAHGDISIDAAVTQVDAYLFADGTVDTCTAGGGATACGTQVLLVNGFLMGRAISFSRTGANGTSGSQLAEQIVMNPQIYLNPPKFFDASVDDDLLLGQGERQPLF